MKLTTLLMIIGCIHLSAAGYSQKINLSERNVSLNSVFSKMEKQSGYHFFSNSEFIGALPNVSVSIKNATLSEALDELLSKLSLSYSIVDKTVVITPVNETVNGTKKTIPLLVIGAVLDDQGKPIPGANVKVKGTIQRTVTDQDGKFKILVTDADAILQISYVGYQSREIPVKTMKNPYVIELKAITSDLDQVQILAYSTTTQRTSTGSSYTIKSDELMKNPVPNVLQMIQNRVPGLSIVQNTGQPGGSFNVKIRGTNGFNNVDPLYIVDGVAFPAGGNNQGTVPGGGALPILGGINNTPGVMRGGNALNYLNPADIESIDILKDADATAIYGSRGAYGVILITTKRAKGGKPKLDLNLNTGLTVVGTSPQLLGTADYLMLRREAFKNDGKTPSATDLDVNGTYPEDRYTNWQKVLTGHSASTTRLNTSYSGGNNTTNFLISGSYNNQDNVQSAKGSNRDGGLRFDLNNTSLDKKFSIDLSGSFNSTVNTMVPYDFSNDGSTLKAPNGPPLFLPDGNINWETGSNSASAINLNYRGVTNNLLANSTLSYKPIKGLTIRAVIGYNLLGGNELRSVPTTFYNPSDNARDQKSNSISNIYSIRSWTFDPNINYTTKAGAKGTLTLTTGATFQDKMNETSQINGTGFISDALLNNPSAGTTVTSLYNKFISRYLGYFGIANYNWANKYILNVNARYDGSTKFGPDYRFGTFGSAALAYIFTEEKWVKETLPFLSFGKLRGSYGTVGGDGINNYLFLPTYTITSSYLGQSALTSSTLANNNLHWEKNIKRDLGITLGFLKDKITVDAGYYKNTTRDQLVPQPLSTVTGFSNIQLNTPAVLQNTGLEFSLTSHNIDNKDFSWTTNFNISLPHSKLVSYPNGLALPNSNFVVGQPITNIRVYNYAGVNPQTGLYNFINAAGIKGSYLLFFDPVTLDQDKDRTQNVDLAPKFEGSLTNTVTYKSLSLDFTFGFVDKMGQNYLGQQMYTPGIMDQNETALALNRWQKPGDITNVPKASTNALQAIFEQNNFRTSTGAYERITYARLQNLSLSYAFTGSFLKRANISNMRIVLQGQNLLTISKYGDLDPENLTAGAMPPLRVFNLGLNLTL